MSDRQDVSNRAPNNRMSDNSVYVSVDVETAGPDPANFSLLSIGACLVSDPEIAFYVELQPIHPNADPKALEVSRLSLAELAAKGIPPAKAMTDWDRWLKENLPPGAQPLFVAFNAPFDWMFVNDYFHRYLGHNPFGHAALDIKSYYMGLKRVSWSETSIAHLAPLYLNGVFLSHHALQDARDQAKLFHQLLAQAQRTKSEL